MAFETILGGINIATNLVSTIASFAQAAEEKEKLRVAEEAAAEAMLEARKRLEVNYYEQLGIQKEPYELARRELLAQGALATEVLKEGDARALAAGVGRVQLAQQAGQEKVATAMQQEQAMLDKLIAGEETRLADIGSQLYLQEAIGAQEAAADAQKAEAQALQQGFAGVTRLGAQLAAIPQLYGLSDEALAAKGIDRDLRQELRQQQRGERQELRQGFKEQLSGTPMGKERQELRQLQRDEMQRLRRGQMSARPDNLRNVLSNVDVDSLKLSSNAKAILVDPVTKRVRGPEELSDKEFQAFTESLSLPVLQGLRKFAGLDVSTRGRNADPSDIGLRQLSTDLINPIPITPAEQIYNIPESPIKGTPNFVPNQLMQQMSLVSPLLSPFNAFDLFNIYRR
jgi:hypothetical protein